MSGSEYVKQILTGVIARASEAEQCVVLDFSNSDFQRFNENRKRNGRKTASQVMGRERLARGAAKSRLVGAFSPH